MKFSSLSRRLESLEAQQPSNEDDCRRIPGWVVYKQTLLNCLASYPQEGLMGDIQKAFDDMESRITPIKDSDLYYSINPILRKHRQEFAPDPGTADLIASTARFKASGLSDEDLVDYHKRIERGQEEDKLRVAGRCVDCGADIKSAPHKWTTKWSDGDLVTIPKCANCYRPYY